MTNVINLDEKRLTTKSGLALRKVELNKQRPIIKEKINNALEIFGALLFLANRRQRGLLTQIWNLYCLQRSPIEVEEMAERMIAYTFKNKRYFESKLGISLAFDFNDTQECKMILKRINASKRKLYS